MNDEFTIVDTQEKLEYLINHFCWDESYLKEANLFTQTYLKEHFIVYDNSPLTVKLVFVFMFKEGSLVPKTECLELVFEDVSKFTIRGHSPFEPIGNLRRDRIEFGFALTDNPAHEIVARALKYRSIPAVISLTPSSCSTETDKAF